MAEANIDVTLNIPTVPDSLLPVKPTSALILTLQQAQELYWILDVFKLRLDSTYQEAEHVRDQLLASAAVPGDAAALRDIRQTCADVLGVVPDRRDDTLTLFRRLVERAQANARALRDQAERRLELLGEYSGGIRSGSSEDVAAYEAEAARSLAEGRLLNAANAQALCLINRLLVALDEQGKESERRHRVTNEDLRRHQESANELAGLFNEAMAELDRLGVPSGTNVAARIREFAQARILVATGNGDVTAARLQERQIDAARLRTLEPILVEIRKHVAVALLEDQATTDEDLLDQVARVSALAAQARCALGVLTAVDPYVSGQQKPRAEDAGPYTGAAHSHAQQGLPLLSRANSMVADWLLQRAEASAVHALLDEVGVSRWPGATLVDRVRALIQRREHYSRLPEVPAAGAAKVGA